MFPGSAAYWEYEYSKGGTSGPGSYGELAHYKASVINKYVKDNSVVTVTEFGCGDGNQLALAAYPSYVGLDVSPTAIQRCIERFALDDSKSFLLYNSSAFQDNRGCVFSDLALSLDVIYHLVEDDVYERYMHDLFRAADKHVIIYSVNDEFDFVDAYSRPRRFTDWVERNRPDWNLQEVQPNPMGLENRADGSWSDFYFFVRNLEPSVSTSGST